MSDRLAQLLQKVEELSKEVREYAEHVYKDVRMGHVDSTSMGPVHYNYKEYIWWGDRHGRHVSVDTPKVYGAEFTHNLMSDDTLFAQLKQDAQATFNATLQTADAMKGDDGSVRSRIEQANKQIDLLLDIMVMTDPLYVIASKASGSDLVAQISEVTGRPIDTVEEAIRSAKKSLHQAVDHLATRQLVLEQALKEDHEKYHQVTYSKIDEENNQRYRFEIDTDSNPFACTQTILVYQENRDATGNFISDEPLGKATQISCMRLDNKKQHETTYEGMLAIGQAKRLQLEDVLLAKFHGIREMTLKETQRFLPDLTQPQDLVKGTGRYPYTIPDGVDRVFTSNGSEVVFHEDAKGTMRHVAENLQVDGQRFEYRYRADSLHEFKINGQSVTEKDYRVQLELGLQRDRVLQMAEAWSGESERSEDETNITPTRIVEGKIRGVEPSLPNPAAVQAETSTRHELPMRQPETPHTQPKSEATPVDPDSTKQPHANQRMFHWQDFVEQAKPFKDMYAGLKSDYLTDNQKNFIAYAANRFLSDRRYVDLGEKGQEIWMNRLANQMMSAMNRGELDVPLEKVKPLVDQQISRGEQAYLASQRDLVFNPVTRETISFERG